MSERINVACSPFRSKCANESALKTNWHNFSLHVLNELHSACDPNFFVHFIMETKSQNGSFTYQLLKWMQSTKNSDMYVTLENLILISNLR